MSNTKKQTNTSLTTKGLSTVECTVIRGIAILGIMLHNYCHWLPNIVRENEYTYNEANVKGFWFYITQLNEMFFVHFTSFFGHYGVPLFVFLSAYGLEKKYAFTNKTVGLGVFMLKHYVKLLVMLIVGLIPFAVIEVVLNNNTNYILHGAVRLITMSRNISAHPEDVIYPGPYWFFGLMLQLYFIYKLFIYKRHWGFIVGLIVICMAVQAYFLQDTFRLNIIRYNSLGSLLPFGLGALYARYTPQLNSLQTWGVCLLSAMAIIVGSIWAETWLFVPIFVCTFGVSLVKILPSFVNKFFAFIGGISAALFVIHPSLRSIFMPLGKSGEVYMGLSLYALTAIFAAFLLQPIINKITKKALSWF